MRECDELEQKCFFVFCFATLRGYLVRFLYIFKNCEIDCEILVLTTWQPTRGLCVLPHKCQFPKKISKLKLIKTDIDICL